GRRASNVRPSDAANRRSACAACTARTFGETVDRTCSRSWERAMAERERILFVYNVDLTLVALVSDFVHRLRSPETYPCRLCDVTYDRFTMKREWKRFVESLPVEVDFELRDRFRKKYPSCSDVGLPAVFRIDRDGRPSV